MPYRAGVASVLHGNDTVTFSGASTSANMKPGDMFSLAEDVLGGALEFQTIKTVGSGSIVLDKPYQGADNASKAYVVLHTSEDWNDISSLHQDVADFIGDYRDSLLLTGNDKVFLLNKAALGNQGGFSMQTNGVDIGRVGAFAAGDDNMHIQVNPTGSAWIDALVADKATGVVGFPAGRDSSSTDIASNSTCDIGALGTEWANVAGSTTVTSFGTKPKRIRYLTVPTGFAVTYNATTMKTLTGANRTYRAGSVIGWRSDASGNWSEFFYQPPYGDASVLTSGHILVGSSGGVATDVAVSGDAMMANTGALTVASIGGKAVTLGGALTTSGAYALTLTLTGATGVALPTIGTLATLAGAETLTNKTINASSNTLSNLTTAMFAANVVDTDATMAAASATRVPAQSAVRSYIDNAVTGLFWKPAMQAASTANVSVSSAPSSLDGVAGVSGVSRWLLKNQTAGAENGLYLFNGTGSALTRVADADTGAEILGATVFVESGGTVNGDTQWTNTNTSAPTIGTTAITFAQLAGAGTYSAGAGLSLSGNQFAIDGTVATLTGAQNLTNKTITSAAMSGTFTGAHTYSGALTLSAVLTYGGVTLANAVTGTGKMVLDTSPNFTGPIGIGMTPINVLDITQSQNTQSRISILNSNSGTITSSCVQVSNGTNVGKLVQFGMSYTTSSIFRQDGTIIYAGGAGGLTINTGAAQPIYFGVNNTEVAQVDTSGNLLVGTSASLARVAAVGSATGEYVAAYVGNSHGSDGDSVSLNFSAYTGNTVSAKIKHTRNFGSGGDLIFSAWNGALVEAMRINGAGPYLLVGYTASQGAYNLQVNSQIFATSATIATSDLRLKDVFATSRPFSFNGNIVDAAISTAMLAAVRALPVIMYRRTDRPEDGFRAGYGAQHWQQVLNANGFAGKGIVTVLDGGKLALDEGAANTLKIAAIENSIDIQEQRVARLEARVEQLKNAA